MSRPARTLPGAVIHCWDHLVMTLRDGATETAFLSLYAIAYSASLGGGHVALLEVADGPNGPLALTLADPIDLGRRQQERLGAMGLERPALAADPVPARFERLAWREDGFGFRIRAERADGRALQVEASWADPGRPFWVDGSGGAFGPTEEIWAMFVEARAPRLVVDGRVVPGRPFDDPGWTDRLGRSLGSAHAAFAEVRVEPGPVSGRARGGGSA